MDKADNRKYAIYSRKSKFTGKGDSIENQIELCKRKILNSDLNATESDILIFEDEGFSGKNTNRPQFQAMMKKCRQNEIKAIVCYRLDRVSRSVSDFSKLLDELEPNNVSFISATEEFETSSPMGKTMMRIVAVFAEFERDTIAERIRDNMLELAKSGRWLGGTTPTGYKGKELTTSYDFDGKIRKMHKLETVPEEEKIIKTLFAEFLKTTSLTKVETYCINYGIKTKNGKDFSRFTIKAILQNPVYMTADHTAWKYFQSSGVILYAEESAFNGNYGISSYNKTIQTSGKANKMRSRQDWIVTVGKHKPMISSMDWIQVQELLEQNKSKSFRKPKNNTALLSGLLRCRHCGSYMRPKMDHRTKLGSEQRFHYLCEMKEKSRLQQCDMKNAQGNEIDKLVWNKIIDTIENPAAYMEDLAKAKEKISQSNSHYYERLELLKKSRSEKERQIQNYFEQFENETGEITAPYLSERVDALHEKKLEIEQEILEVESKLANKELSKERFDTIAMQLLNYDKIFDAMDIEEKRKALRLLIDRVEWDGSEQTAHIYLFGSEEKLGDLSEPKRGYSQ